MGILKFTASWSEVRVEMETLSLQLESEASVLVSSNCTVWLTLGNP